MISLKRLFLYLLFLLSSFAQSKEELIKQIDSLNNLAFISRGANPLLTIKYSESALKLGKSIDYPLGKCISYSFIGVGYRNMSYFKEALGYYLKGLRLADSIENTEQIAFAYNNIGNLYLRSGNDSLARVYLEKTLELAEQKKYGVLLGYAYKNMGSYYFVKKDYEKALNFLKKSLKEREDINDYWGITNTLNEIGAVYKEQKDYKTALASYDSALVKVKNIEKNIILMGEIYLGKANVYYEQKAYPQALETADKSRTIFEKLNGRVELVEIYNLISRINYEQFNYKTAFDFLKKHDDLNDSIKVLNAERQLELMELLYTLDKNQKENEILKKDNSIKKLQIEQEQQYRNLLLFISIILLTAAITATVFYKGKKNSNTQLIKKNELIEAQRIELSKINSTKDKLFSIIAHDLKNPFGSLINISDYLSQEINKLSKEEIIELIESINNSAKNSYRLLENLLLWSQAQKGYISYKPELLKLSKLIENNFSLYSETAKEKGIQLEMSLFNDEIFIYADKNMFNAILRNLINNAVKFSNPKTTVRVTAMTNSSKTVISIEDEGIGISQTEINNLFSVEGKEIQSGTKGEKGTGLGLIICKEFIDVNHGEIKIESEKGKGTKIDIIFPNSASSLIVF